MREKLLMKILTVSMFCALIPAQLATASDVAISGFVDMGYYSDANSGMAGTSLDQIELDITASASDAVSTRFDLEFIGDGSIAVEQGFIEIAPSESLKLTFGQFNAPIGFELLDAPDMYQYSHAMVFNSGLPTNLTGVMVSSGFGLVDISAYYVNGWDINIDDNNEKTVGTRIGLTPMETLNLGISYISGKEGAVDPLGLTVTDIDLTFTGVANLTVGFEYNMGVQEASSAVTSGDDATWTGYLLMANYAISDTYGLTFRYDAFDDTEGARLGGGVAEIRNSITLSPSMAIADGVAALFEYKTTTSDQEVFTDKDGNAKKDQTEIAIELTYSF
jgi:hypothetical protein